MTDDVAHEDDSVDSENDGVVNGHDLALADNHEDEEARRVNNEDDMTLDDNNDGVVVGNDDSGVAVGVPVGGVYKSYEDFCANRYGDSLVDNLGYGQGSDPLLNEWAARRMILDLRRYSSTLKSLSYQGTTTKEGWSAIFQLVRDSDSVLEKLTLRSMCDYQGVHSITDEGVADLTNALVNNSVLKELAILGDDELSTNINEAGWVTLSNVLRNPRSALTKLSLLNNTITDNAMQSFADALLANINNSKLRNLDFSGNIDLTETGWATFFAVLHNPNSAVKILHLNNTSINNNVLLSFAEVLNRLQEFSICNNTHVTTAGWIRLFTVLHNPDSALRKLSLADNFFVDVVVDALTMALVGNNRLREVDLSNIILGNNDELTQTGWMGLSTVLRHPNSALEVIELRGIHINDDIMFAFAEALTNNHILRELVLELDLENNITVDGYEAFEGILCNKSSIGSTFTSNHTLEKLCQKSDDSLLPENLKLLLRVNSEYTESQAARLKIIKTHFRGRKVNQMKPFTQMDLSVRPHAIAWMARDDINWYNINVYRFLRAMPSLLEVVPP